jgi:hypothetical protein
LKFSPDKLWEIERLLNEYSFEGIELGGILAVDIQLGLNSGKYLRNEGWIPPLLKSILSVISISLHKGNSTTSANIQGKKGQPVLTFITNREEFFHISGNFLKFSKFEFLSLLLHDGLKDRFENDEIKSKFILHRSLPNVGLLSKFEIWFFVYFKLKVVWKKIGQLFNLNHRVLARIKESLYFQLVLSTKYKYFLDKFEPRFILTEYDRYGSISPLVLQARIKGIPSFSLMHGVINNPFGYLPVLADALFVWGESQKNYLIKFSNDSTKVLVGGAPQFSKTSFSQRNSVLGKLSLDASKKYVVFGSSNVPEPYRKLAMREFCEAASQNNDTGIKFLVKLHPAEQKEYYAEVFNDNNDIMFLPKVGLSKMEFLSFCDLLIIYCSALGFDAILNDCPLIVLNVGEDSIGNSRQFIDEAGVPECFAAQQLLKQIPLSLGNPIDKRTTLFKENYCSKIGKDAVLKIEEIINRILNEKGI